MIEFVEVEAEGEPRALEHAALVWASPEELIDLPMAPADAQFVRSHLLPPKAP